jgi:hypothetical protein
LARDLASFQPQASVAETGQCWRFHWITSWDEVWGTAFMRRWETLLQVSRDAHVFFHPALVRGWVDTFSERLSLEPRFMLAQSAEGETVLLPLVFVRNGWKDLWQRLMVPVGYLGYDYHDPVLDGTDSTPLWTSFWPAFEAELTSRWGGTFDACLLYGLRSRCLPGNPAWSERHIAELGPNRPINGYVAPYADISRAGSIDEFMRTRGANLRGDLARRLRRLEAVGHLTYHVYGGDAAEDARGAVDAMLRENARRWPMARRVRSFYDHLIAHCLPSGLLHLSELQIDRTPISWHLGFVYRDRFYYYLPAFRADYAGYSPGKVHLRMCFADAIERGLGVFDLLSGDEAYKWHWADGRTEEFGMVWPGDGPLSMARRIWGARIKPGLVVLRRRLRESPGAGR